jgi:hypothetical protein
LDLTETELPTFLKQNTILRQINSLTGEKTKNFASYVVRVRKNVMLLHDSCKHDVNSSRWVPRKMVAALASACRFFHWVLAVLRWSRQTPTSTKMHSPTIPLRMEKRALPKE